MKIILHNKNASSDGRMQSFWSVLPFVIILKPKRGDDTSYSPPRLEMVALLVTREASFSYPRHRQTCTHLQAKPHHPTPKHTSSRCPVRHVLRRQEPHPQQPPQLVLHYKYMAFGSSAWRTPFARSTLSRVQIPESREFHFFLLPLQRQARQHISPTLVVNILLYLPGFYWFSASKKKSRLARTNPPCETET